MIKQKLNLIINTIMSIIYIGSGLFLLVGKNLFNFSEVQRIGIGNLLILYGFFRGYALVKRIIESKQNES